MDELRIGFADIYDIEEYVYFTAKNLNILCSLNKINGDVQKICSIAEGELVRYDVFDTIIKHKDKIYVVPGYGKTICIYSIYGKEKKIYEYDEKEKLYIRAIYTGDEIWIIPANTRDDILIFDIHKNEFYSGTEISECIRGLAEVTEASIIGYYSYFCDGDIYLSIINTNKVLKISVAQKKVEMIELPSHFAIRNVVMHNGIIWSTLFDSDVVISYCVKTGRIKEYRPSSDVNDVGLVTNICVYYGHKLICSTKGVYVIDEEGCLYENIENNYYDTNGFKKVCFGKEYMYVYCRDGNVIRMYNKEIKYVSKWELNPESIKKIYIDLLKEREDDCSTKVFYENEYGFSLTVLLEGAETIEKNKNEKEIGNLIWDCISSE